MNLAHKIMGQTLDGEDFQEAGRRLGILVDDTLVFKDEEESNVLTDFALYDLRKDGRSAVEAFPELSAGLNGLEKEVLQAMRSSQSSLFKIEAISASESTLHLRDLLNDRGGIKLIDVAFSRSAVRGLLIFIRLVPFKDIYMTSGISFIFPPDIRIALLKQYEKAVKSAFICDSEGLFLFFHRMNEISGMAVRYE